MRFNKSLFILFLLLTIFSCENGSFDSAGNATGQGGSMTRFAIQGNYLYVADHRTIKVFSIDAGSFTHLKDEFADFSIETIFAKGHYLYLGASDGMYIYSIEVPSSPFFMFRYDHIVSCDPVFVEGKRAYITLHNNNCYQGINALEIVDISNPYLPVMMKSYPMESPLGLSVQNNILFLCNGDHGFKVYDVTDASHIKKLAELHGFNAYDVIVIRNLVTITGEDGIFQYRYDEVSHTLQLLSKIPVDRTAV